MKEQTKMKTVPCPYVYKSGKRCTGTITRVEAYKADLVWDRDADGSWNLLWDRPRSHYHLFCSEKWNHAGVGRSDALKYYDSDLPEDLERIIGASRRCVVPPSKAEIEAREEERVRRREENRRRGREAFKERARKVKEEKEMRERDCFLMEEAAAKRWRVILDGLGPDEIENLHGDLSRHQHGFEQDCGGVGFDGKELMGRSGIGYLMETDRPDSRESAGALVRAIAASTCSIEVKQAAKKAAESFHLDIAMRTT